MRSRISPAVGIKAGIRLWRKGRAWEIANGLAKLAERRKHCEGARIAAMQAKLAIKDPIKAMIEFWKSVEPRTRLVNRMLGDLKHAR